MKRRIALLISGRGSNMEAILLQARTGVLAHCCDPVVVVSSRPHAAGIAVAQALGVSTRVLSSKGVHRAQYDEDLISLLEPYRLDYLVLAGFMRILGPRVVERYRDRIVNIHPADPAQFKGIGGYRWAWQSGLKATMVTVHLVDEGVDT
ncbi:phosphoribosylglycinamide formyltransferase, partial [Candidatus Fermentibacteria bacterium]|nr:phosphoribosylglycinamide formyltransferase [Candidatus Fermentibacteria bacterium]